MRYAVALEHAITNIRRLGARRLIALCAILGLSMSVVGAIGYYYSKPSTEPLYSGLTREDIIGIGSVLREAGIPFDVNADGTVIFTPVAQAPIARMTLAEKGLPHGGNIGNELFDKLGSLGLTSFMQDVTRTRAIEGELARTILMMRGVKAARVHIVMGDGGSFRRERQPPSASVVIRMEAPEGSTAAQAIRRLVSSAVAGMTMANVTVLSSDGSILAAGDEYAEQSAATMFSLEKEIARRLRDNVSQTLAPYLKPTNYQVSVAVRLNTDRRQMSETTYNPESRVERSVRVIKENQTSQNSSTQPPTSVQSNLPQARSSPADAKQANDETQKRDETTNYEVSSKQTNTTSAGYSVESLSVVVLVNQTALMAREGESSEKSVKSGKISEIEDIVASAVGARRDKGDVVKVAAVEFLDTNVDGAEGASSTALEIISRQAGAFAGAAAMVIVAVIVVLFAIRPALNVLARVPEDREWRDADIKSLTDDSAAARVNAEADPMERDVDRDDGQGAPTLSALDPPIEWREIAKVIEEAVIRDEKRASAVLRTWMARESAS